MADEAHKEPTMEEILSSIRKIISEDEVPSAEPAKAELEFADVAAGAADNDDFEELSIDDVAEDGEVSFGDDFEEEDIFEIDAGESSDSFTAEIELPAAEEVVVEAAETVADPAPMIEKYTDPEPPPQPISEPEAQVSAPSPEVELTVAMEEKTSTEEVPPMRAAANHETSHLTDDRTAGAAAGALGALISKMDVSGSDNTIEGLVREMLKPMIKEWLDANLQGIVERKVEAEVQRIANMAR